MGKSNISAAIALTNEFKIRRQKVQFEFRDCKEQDRGLKLGRTMQLDKLYRIVVFLTPS